MTISAEVRALALERRSADEILELAVVQGMHQLKDDGLDTVKQGRTSIAEIARVVNAGAVAGLQPPAFAADMSRRASPWRSSTQKSCLRSWRAMRPTST